MVVVVIDTLRADHMGAYGYDRNTSPYLDSLAAEGLLFEDAQSSSSYTRQAISTLLSGRLPTRAGTTGLWARPSRKAPILPDYFKAAGYTTTFVTNQPSMSGMIPRLDNAHTFNDAFLREPELVEKALELVEQSAQPDGAPYFLYIHHIGPHAPYDPPPEFFERLFGRPERQRMQLSPWADNHQTLLDEGLAPGHPEFDEMVRAYDADIAFTEDSVRSLMEGLRERGLLENTVVLFTSDHGEEFFDHGYLQHSWTLFDEVLHVPLILWADGQLEPARISSPVSHADVVPTLLTLFDIPYDPAAFDGSSFLKNVGGEFVFNESSKPRIAELVFPEKTVQRAVSHDSWKLYTATKWIPPAGRYAADAQFKKNRQQPAARQLPVPPLWSPYEFQALFDLESDPGEQINVIDQHRDRVAALEAHVANYRIAVEQRGLGPKWGGPNDAIGDQGLEALEALGYVH